MTFYTGPTVSRIWRRFFVQIAIGIKSAYEGQLFSMSMGEPRHIMRGIVSIADKKTKRCWGNHPINRRVRIRANSQRCDVFVPNNHFPWAV